MNNPPENFICVPHNQLSDFVSSAAQKVGLPEDKAALLGRLLTDNDLRGVFSHGTIQIATYAIHMRDGRLNCDPQVHVVNESPTSVLVDGDGGIGYFAAHEGTQRVIDKALDQGIAVMTSRNHGHFGAAGLYSRMTLKHDLITFVTSGVQLNLKPGQPLHQAAGGSPMSFSAPAAAEDSLVLDFGTMHDLYGGDPLRDKMATLAPGLVLRCIGMGEICQAWGGLWSGLRMNAPAPRWTFSGANQGAMVVTMRIDLFLDASSFKREMDEYVRCVKQLEPLEGFDQSYMPGGVEANRERQYRREGVPVGSEHRQALESLAEELDIDVPWGV